MNRCHAVLLDTVSIQRYIFESNKLKENLGASFLIEDIYATHLKTAVSAVFGESFGGEFNMDAWKERPGESAIAHAPFEIAYMGGGNAMLLFRDEPAAKEFIRVWTRTLLVHCPGLVTATASGPMDPDHFGESQSELFRLLRRNKSTDIPITALPTHGITAQCTHSGLSMEVWSKSETAYVSSGTHAKIEAAIKSQNRINSTYKDLLKDEFRFTDQLEKLGQIAGEESHIAIVHIDGNGMGKRFRAMQTLKDMRALSKSVADATMEAFTDLLRLIVHDYDAIMESLGFDDSSKDENRRYPLADASQKKLLPLRPIILGGDDLTFVCDGRLGIYFARLFIEALEKKQISDGKKLTACAGISVTKSKYPFYRGYQLAEALCGHAKTIRHANGDSFSYLDFHISSGGFSGTLDDIREKHFQVQNGTLLYRPYRLSGDINDEQGVDLLVQNTAKLKDEFPRNKIKELRQVLTLSEEARVRFVAEMKDRGRTLPEIPGRSYADSLFVNVKTPYFDMIELMSFYPDYELLPKGGPK
jgi:hypothetical protein